MIAFYVIGVLLLIALVIYLIAKPKKNKYTKSSGGYYSSSSSYKSSNSRNSGCSTTGGLIYFDSIEQYYQFLANEYGGWTEPSVRIFYLDGSKKEIFTKKIKE